MASPDSDTSAVLTYAVGIGGPIILGLIGVIWNLVRQEAKANSEALDKKASAEALKEAKQDFATRLEKLHSDYRQLLQEVSMRQDREIDWLKDEMDKISGNITELRRENNTANATILQRLQDLAMNIGKPRT